MPLRNPLRIVITIAVPDGEQVLTVGDEDDMPQNWQLRNADYTPQNRDRIIADTTAGAWTLTLPPGARYGDEIEVLIDGANALTLNPNGAKVNGAVEPLAITSDRAKLAIVYKDSDKGWIVGTGSTASTGGGGTEPTPTPTFEYTATQSSVYAGTSTGTYANLTDSDGATGTGTNNGDSWIKATFAEAKTITAITVGGGNLPSFGEVATYLNNAKLQYSTDDSVWTDALTISGVTNSGATQFKKFPLSSAVSARYWRLSLANYLATTEFKFE